MRKILPSLKIIPILLIAVWSFQAVKGQTLLTENFEYANGTLLTAAGWAAHSGAGTQAVDVIVPGLTFTGYPLSNIGGAAQLDNNGEDVNKTFAVQTSGAVYMACLVKANALADGYFMHLGGDPIGTTFRAKVFTAGTADPFNFGISVGANTAITVSGGSFNLAKIYLLVVKYEVVDGTTNDKVSLFVFSGTVPATEPATASVGPLTDANMSDINPGSIAMRQFSASENIQVDGIRIGKTWADAVTSTTADVTSPVFNPGFPNVANIKSTQADLQVNLDEAGKAFYVVVKDGDPVPTATHVFAGVNYGTVTLVTAGNVAVPSGGSVVSATLTGLTDKTNYDIYVVAQDDESSPNKQTTPAKVDLYTIRPADVISSADFNTTLSPFTQVSLTGNEVWEQYNVPSSEIKCAKISGYVGSTYYENLDYLISPQINLDASDINKLSFSTAKNYTGPALKVMISGNFNGTFTADGVKAATWTDITSNFAFSSGLFTFVPSGEYSLAAYSGKVYIAFVFESTTSQSSTWEIDNFLVTGYLKNTTVTSFSEERITLYPVPARNEITFSNLKGVSNIEVFDIHGRKQIGEIIYGETIKRMNITKLHGGIYLVRFKTSGGSEVMKFIKE